MENKYMYIIGFILLVLVILAFFIFANRSSKEVLDNTIDEDVVIVKKEKISGTNEYIFDIVNSNIEWEAKKTFNNDWVDVGNISLSSGNILIKENLISAINLDVDMNSILAKKTGANSGEDKLSNHLKSADFFNVEDYPNSKFSLISITPTENEFIYNVVGDMTIKNTTNSIEFPATIFSSNNKIYLDANFSINRALFNVRFGSSSFFNDIGDKAINDNFNLKIKLLTI